MDNKPGARQWKLLLVDDDEDEYILVQQMLLTAQSAFCTLEWADSYTAGRRALQEKKYDVVLMDYDLGEHTGLELIREMYNDSSPTAFILYTGRGSREVDLEAMEAGVSMYLTKGETSGLALERGIRYAIEMKQNEVSLRQVNRELEEELARRKLAEDKFALAFANNPAAIALTRLEDGIFLDVNTTWEELNGYCRDEVIGQSARDLPIWPSKEDRLRFVQELREKESIRGWEQPFFNRSGREFIADLSAQVLSVNGEKMILSTFVDITDRTKAQAQLLERNDELQIQKEELEVQTEELRVQGEELTFSNDQLRASEARLNSFLESTHDNFLALDRTWHFTYSNRRYAEALGYEPQDLIGKGFWTVCRKYLGTPIEASYRKAMDERVVVHFSYDGLYSDAYYDVSIYPTPDGIFAFATDRTQQKRAEAMIQVKQEELETANRQLSAITEAFPSAISVMTMAGYPLYVNNAYAELLGYTIDEIKGMKAEDVYSNPNDRKEMITALKREGVVSDYEVQLKRKDGSSFTAFFYAASIRYGDVFAIMSTVFDASISRHPQKPEK